MYKVFRLLAAHIRENITDITWIDRDKGQIENPESFNSILIPGILIDFASVRWKGKSRGNQLGEGSVTFKLVFTLPPATHQDGHWNEHEQFETLPDRLYETLLNHPNVGDRRSSSDYFTGNFYVVEQTFDLKVYQELALTTIPKPTPNIQGSIQTTLTIHT